ncbi:MAG: hypothetical protein NZ826_05470 [Thermodesulfovibrio sp.]|nr:hypothetical protein [Thermodesulfovibrio sp.]
MSKKIRGKFGVPMFSFSLTPSPIKDLKMLQRLEAIKDASQRKEVAFRLLGYSNLSSRSGRDFWSKFKAEAPFEIRGRAG